MTAQVRAAHARKAEARAKVEDLLGGGFDYDALRAMARRAREELRGKDEPGMSKSARSAPVFAAGAKASTLAARGGQRQGPFARGAVYAPPASRGTRLDDDAVAFEDAILNPALELDPDTSVEGFRAAIAAEVSARIAASKGAVKAEATQLYKASASGAHAWRGGRAAGRAEFGIRTTAGETNETGEPTTTFIVGGDGSIGRAVGGKGAGKKPPAFGVAEGHYGRDPAKIARVVRVAGKGGNHGYPDRRFVKGKWAPPPPRATTTAARPARSKSAPPARPAKGPTLATDRHRRAAGGRVRKGGDRSSVDRFSDGEGFDDEDDDDVDDDDDEKEDGITATVRKATAMRREAAASLARRREERMKRAARARAEAELRRTAEAEASAAEAERRRGKVAEEAKRRLRRRPVAFGGRVDVPKVSRPEPRTAADDDGRDGVGAAGRTRTTDGAPPRDEDGKLIPRPFKLSEPKPRAHGRRGMNGEGDEDEDENAPPPPPRDPDVWESPEEEKARLEKEAREKEITARRRKELAERANEYGTRAALTSKGAGAPGSDVKRRSLQETFAEARRRRGEEAERNAERARSRETLRQSAVVAAAAQVAAPAIAAAEAAQRNASAAAAAAAKAASAAAAAEALMISEARRLRERRKRLHAAGGNGADIDADIGADIDVTAWGGANARTDGVGASFDDAVPLMASLGDGELRAYAGRSPAVDSNRDAELPDADADAPVPSTSPEKAKETDDDDLAPRRDSRRDDDGVVSESRKSDAPSPIATAPAATTPGGDRPVAGGDSPGGGAEGAEGADRSDPSAFETSIAKDAAALANALPPETADKVAKTSRRVAERRRRNTTGETGTGAGTNGRRSPPTPPTPRSPAVTWRVGARALPAPLRQPVFESSAHLPSEEAGGGASAEAATDETRAAGSAGFDLGTSKSARSAVFAIKAAEARAAAMAELAPAIVAPNDDSAASASTSALDASALDASVSASAEARAPAAPKFLRGGDLYDYVPPERVVDRSAGDDDDDADDSEGDDWLRRGSADSSDFDRTALTDGRSMSGRSESNPDLSLTRSATAAIAREMTAGAGRRGEGRSGFYIRRSHPEGRAALAAALAGEESDLSDVASSVESLE